MTHSTRRRWFRFTLRTLLVIVALLAVFLAYHVNWIRERRALIAKHKELSEWYGQPMQIAAVSVIPRDGPGLLWMFGERKIIQLSLIGPYEPTGAEGTWTASPGPPKHPDYQRARRLFPEADILVYGLQRTIAP